jgi:hypothetical protein
VTEQPQTDPSLEAVQPVPVAPSENSTSPLNEDLALAQLKNRDLSPDSIEKISQASGLIKSRKVRLALASHPHTPRRIALRVVRELYTFDLMQFALTPTAPADLRRIGEELLVNRLSSITLGERISLARRASGMVAAALLLDKETRVWQTALENPRLTEVSVVRAVQKTGATAAFVVAVRDHSKWSLRPEVRIALLRNAHTPLAKAIEFVRGIPAARLRDILRASRLPEKIKAYLRQEAEGSP